MLFYSNDPYDADNTRCQDGNYPNGISDGEINGGLSHEHMESVTDPIPNDAWTNGFGADQGEEIGDQCNRVRGNPLGTAPNGANYNQVINGHFYWYQEEWSNWTHSCVQRLTLPSTLPSASETVTHGSGTDMTFDAGGSTAPGGVADYSWQFNDAFAAQTVEQTTPTITHTFPAAGAYSTGVAVFASDGLSAGTGGIVTTGQDGFTPAFTFSRGGAGGKTVSFSALTTVSGKPVLSYLWEFGDGSTGSGPTPTHTYSRPGTYKVKAVLFSGVGSAFPGDGAGPVYAQNITVGGAG
jgi:plastocyanin